MKVTADNRLPDLAYKIRQRRYELGYKSGETFAKEKGINRSIYQRWEQGYDMNMSSYLRLCDALLVDPADFLK